MMESNGTEEVEQELGMHRVKVYRLNERGTWDDKGEGFLTIQHLEQSAAMGLVVMEASASPASPKTLLIHRVSQEDIYMQQSEDTIITWHDAETKTDIALSFQEAAGCQTMWEQIRQEQGFSKGRLGKQRGNLSASPSSEWKRVSKDFDQCHDAEENGLKRPLVDEMEGANGMDDMREMSAGPVSLPEPELRNLEQIAKVLSEDLSPMQKEQVASKMLEGKYIRKLLDIFRTCEDLEDAASLRQLFDIFKGVVMLNDTSLMDLLFAEENVMDVVGALEYDPELPSQQQHRKYLRDVVVFKEVVPMHSAELRSKIHQTYRIGYVKDVILPRLLDDATFATLSSIMVFNNVDVLLGLMEDQGFFRDLFRRFRSAAPGSEAQADIVSFLQELTNLSKSLPHPQRASLLQKLVSLGLFEAVNSAIRHFGEEVQLKATDVLLTCLHHEPQMLREFLMKTGPTESPAPSGGAPKVTLFDNLIKLLTQGVGIGLQEQVVEILRGLLDSESLSVDAEKSEFLETFYSLYMKQLCGIIEAGGKKEQSAESRPSASAVNLILQILCFCVRHHGFRIKNFMLRNGTIEMVLKLLHRRERWLVIAAIRFIRTCIAQKDEFYNRHMVNLNLLEPVVTVFVANGERYNLLNSVVLELFDFVWREGIKSLTIYFTDKLYPLVEDVDYDATFLKLKNKFDQGNEQGGRESAAAAASQLQIQRIRKDERALDKGEESYFSEDNDDDDGGAADQIPPQLFNGEPPRFLPRNALGLEAYDDERDSDEDVPASEGLKRTASPPNIEAADKRSRTSPGFGVS